MGAKHPLFIGFFVVAFFAGYMAHPLGFRLFKTQALLTTSPSTQEQCLVQCSVERDFCEQNVYSLGEYADSRSLAACEENYNYCANQCEASYPPLDINAITSQLEQAKTIDEVIRISLLNGLSLQQETLPDSTRLVLVLNPVSGETVVAASEANQTAVGNTTGGLAVCGIDGIPGVKVHVWGDGKIYGIRNNYGVTVDCASGNLSSSQCENIKQSTKAATNAFDAVSGGPKSTGGQDLVVVTIEEAFRNSSNAAQASQVTVKQSDGTSRTACYVRLSPQSTLITLSDTSDLIGFTIEHELGHCFGFGHSAAGEQNSLIMARGSQPDESAPFKTAPIPAGMATVLQQLKNGSTINVVDCIRNCFVGTDWNSLLAQCVPSTLQTQCPEGQVRDPNTGQCVSATLTPTPITPPSYPTLNFCPGAVSAYEDSEGFMHCSYMSFSSREIECNCSNPYGITCTYDDGTTAPTPPGACTFGITGGGGGGASGDDRYPFATEFGWCGTVAECTDQFVSWIGSICTENQGC